MRNPNERLSRLEQKCRKVIDDHRRLSDVLQHLPPGRPAPALPQPTRLTARFDTIVSADLSTPEKLDQLSHELRDLQASYDRYARPVWDAILEEYQPQWEEEIVRILIAGVPLAGRFVYLPRPVAEHAFELAFSEILAKPHIRTFKRSLRDQLLWYAQRRGIDLMRLEKRHPMKSLERWEGGVPADRCDSTPDDVIDDQLVLTSSQQAHLGGAHQLSLLTVAHDRTDVAARALQIMSEDGDALAYLKAEGVPHPRTELFRSKAQYEQNVERQRVNGSGPSGSPPYDIPILWQLLTLCSELREAGKDFQLSLMWGRPRRCTKACCRAEGTLTTRAGQLPARLHCRRRCRSRHELLMTLMDESGLIGHVSSPLVDGMMVVRPGEMTPADVGVVLNLERGLGMLCQPVPAGGAEPWT